MDRYTWERAVFAADLSPTTKLVALAISNHLSRNLNSAAWPSQARLAQMTGVARETVSRAISRLAAAHLVEVSRTGRSNSYRCQLPTGETCDGASQQMSAQVTSDVTPGHKEVPIEPSKEPTTSGAVTAPAQKEYMKAIIEMMGRDPQGGERAYWGSVARQARAEAVDPDGFLSRAAEHRRRWPTVAVSPGSVWKHWGELAQPAPSADGIDWSKYRNAAWSG